MEKYMELFRAKINRDYLEYLNKIALMDKADLITKASEISIMNWLHTEFQIPEHFPSYYIQYLSQFDHPLNMVLDAWQDDEHSKSDRLHGLLWSMADKRDCEDGYIKSDPVDEDDEEL